MYRYTLDDVKTYQMPRWIERSDGGFEQVWSLDFFDNPTNSTYEQDTGLPALYATLTCDSESSSCRLDFRYNPELGALVRGYPPAETLCHILYVVDTIDNKVAAISTILGEPYSEWLVSRMRARLKRIS